LEYRGYDSVGFATLELGTLHVKWSMPIRIQTVRKG